MDDFLWECDALLAVMNGRPVGQIPEGVTGISIDSRTLRPGDAYFAIKGEVHDGHTFVSAAFKSGAALAVVSEDKLVALGHVSAPLIVVRDVLEAMRRLGQAARARCKAKIIAVTGSVGKTTTKEMLQKALSASGKVHASVASYNNHWGVPLSLARMAQDTRFGIFEIGMNHAGEITPLVKMVRPHVAIVTNVAAAHLGAFKNLNEIARAKAEIFEGVVAGGHALINKDDARAGLLVKAAGKAGIEHIKTFGEKRGADYWLSRADYHEEGTDMVARIRGVNHALRINVPGKHLALNALAVLGAGDLTGADIKKTAEAIALVEPEAGRGIRYELRAKNGRFLLIDESYNANPASMRAAISVLGMFKPGSKGRRVAILGDMLELGPASEQLHREIAADLVDNNVNRLFTVGEMMAVLGKEVGPKIHGGSFEKWQDSVASIENYLRAGDVVMVKASNGLGFASFVTALCEAFAPTQRIAKQTGT